MTGQVRMNTISGVQWFLPMALGRAAAGGAGRFLDTFRSVASFYRGDIGLPADEGQSRYSLFTIFMHRHLRGIYLMFLK